MPHNLSLRLALARTALAALPLLATAQSTYSFTGTPAAQALYKKAQAAENAGKNADALRDDRQAVAADPDYAEAQSDYAFLQQTQAAAKEFAALGTGHATAAAEQALRAKMKAVRAQLLAHYQALAAQHPRDPVYLYVLGSLNDEQQPQQAIADYRHAIELDAQYAPAYAHLSYLDEARGALAASRDDLRLAALYQPQSAEAQFDYAYSFLHSDPAQFRKLALQVVHDFPHAVSSGVALYWLAIAAPADQEKIHFLTMRRGDAALWDSFGSGADELLFTIYDRTDPAQALTLAQQMVKRDPDDSDETKPILKYAEAMARADTFLAQGKGKQALAALGNIRLPRWMPQQPRALMRARAQAAAGETQAAFDGLLADVARAPSPQTLTALDAYGKKLGKNATAVAAALWSVREKAAHPATSFALANYRTGKTMMLADLRGHVFLLNFFFPECGPCRGEFPYIRSVLNKYQSQGFRIVTINVEPHQDAFVLAELKGYGLDFIPLRASNDWAAKNYHVRGEPTSFLIGADGKQYFGPLAPVSSPDAQKTLEMQITALLQHAGE